MSHYGVSRGTVSFPGHAGRAAMKFYRPRIEALEPRQVLAAPTLGQIAGATLISSSPLCIALEGADADGDRLTYRASVAGSEVTATLRSGDPRVRMFVDDASDNIHGELVFEFFPDIAPQIVARLGNFISQGAFQNLVLDRVADGFALEGIDLANLGLSLEGGSNLHQPLTSAGVLALAKGVDGSQGLQLLISDRAAALPDVDHSIVGFLVDQHDATDPAGDLLAKIEAAESGAGAHVVQMTQALLGSDSQHAVLQLSAPRGATGTADITVTVSDGTSEASRSFQVAIQPSANDQAVQQLSEAARAVKEEANPATPQGQTEIEQSLEIATSATGGAPVSQSDANIPLADTAGYDSLFGAQIGAFTGGGSANPAALVSQSRTPAGEQLLDKAPVKAETPERPKTPVEVPAETESRGSEGTRRRQTNYGEQPAPEPAPEPVQPTEPAVNDAALDVLWDFENLLAEELSRRLPAEEPVDDSGEVAEIAFEIPAGAADLVSAETSLIDLVAAEFALMLAQ